jgi:predicted RNase H-like nuclease (RuvC/YqgF family)
MGYEGGAPSWVVKRRAESAANAAASSYRTQISQLEEKIKTLEEENRRLKNQLDEANRKCEESD